MRITRLFVLLGLAALLVPRAEASRASVWERNPPASLTATSADAAGLLASLAPAAPAGVEITEAPRFDLGDVVLADTANTDAERFNLGPLTLVDLNLLRGPPPSYPETRVGGFELLPPFRVGASASLSLWSRRACGFVCREVASDSRYDPWGLCGKRGEPPCSFGTNEKTGGEWFAENVLSPVAGAYEAAWEWGLEKTGGNYANREFIETATGLGMFRGLRLLGATKYVAQRSVTAAGKFLDKMPVDAREFSPSAFGVGNLRTEGPAVQQAARRIGQRALPAAEDFPWVKYQKHVSGVDYEEIWLMNQRQVGVDARTAGYTVEAKWAGKNAAAWKSSPYNPASDIYDEEKILDQTRRLLELDKQSGGRGVRYALSNDPAAKHFTELLERNFPTEAKAGTLKVWMVPGTGM